MALGLVIIIQYCIPFLPQHNTFPGQTKDRMLTLILALTEHAQCKNGGDGAGAGRRAY